MMGHIISYVQQFLTVYLVCSGHGELVISILVDLNGFWTYENREVLVTDSAKEAELAVK